MLKELDEIKSKAIDELSGISDIKALEDWRVRYLGKKSALTQVLRGLAALPLEQRKGVGASANEVKVLLEAALARSKRFGRWSLGLLMLFVVLACAGCPPSLAGDWELKLSGVASSSGFVGYELDGELFTVDVETGETAEQIGPRLTALMKAEGLTVECELYDGERYYFIVRDIDGPPESQSHALGIGGGSCGPLQDDRMLIELQVKGFYAILNANKQTGLRDYTTVEYRQDALDVMASMADSGEQIVLESVENMTVDCYQATVCLHLIRVVGTEQQPIDTCLTLTRPSPCEEWLVSGGVIR